MFGLTMEDLQRYGPVIGLLGTILGLIFTGLQIRKNTQIQRAQFLLGLTNRNLDKDKAWDMFFAIEKGELTAASLAEREKENALDALLYHFEIVGRLYQMGVITILDAEFYGYEIRIVFANEQVKKYLQGCDDDAAKKNVSFPYSEARRLAHELGRIQHTLKN